MYTGLVYLCLSLRVGNCLEFTNHHNFVTFTISGAQDPRGALYKLSR
jgi:hypothetical protein